MKKSAQGIVRWTRGRGTGNAADNTLTALDGNDTLDGGKGADALIGGAGEWGEVANDAVFEMRRVG